MRNQFKKSERLLKSSEFKDTLDHQSKKMVGPKIIMIGRRSNLETSRIGMIVSRKAGNAVVRNRFKRLIRESFRTQKAALSGWEIVVIAKSNLDIKSLSFASISHEFKRHALKLS